MGSQVFSFFLHIMLIFKKNIVVLTLYMIFMFSIRFYLLVTNYLLSLSFNDLTQRYQL